MFIARDENRTSLVHDFDKLAEKYSDCFYRNENSAIDLCDGNMVTYFKADGNECGRNFYELHFQRGILHHKSRNLIIHPLPNRFGSSSHIAYESDNAQVLADMFGKETNDNVAGLLFEPELSEFEPNESNNSAAKSHGHRTRRRASAAGSTFGRKIPQMLYVETAIFVDKDLFRHMAKNFPKNTEGNLIRFVLAMINGVCTDGSGHVDVRITLKFSIQGAIAVSSSVARLSHQFHAQTSGNFAYGSERVATIERH